MHFAFGRRAKRANPPAITIPFRTGDSLIDATGERFVIGYRDDETKYLILRPEGAPKDAGNIRYLAYEDLDASWTHVPRKEVRTMARPSVPTPPKMTKAEWLKRDKTKVTLTRDELDHMARLMTAGRSLIRDGKSISPKLKAAMSRLGISTQGL